MYLKQNKSDDEKFQKLIRKSEYVNKSIVIKLFDLNTLECIRTFIGHESEINAINKLSTDTIPNCSDRSIKHLKKTLDGHSKYYSFI
jgi:WD40 repeat protein